jgi:predicted metalloendopeptidase
VLFFVDKKIKITEMVHEILDVFKQRLRSNEWMDKESKIKALEKADLILPKVGYPAYFYNRTYIEENFQVNELMKNRERCRAIKKKFN